MTDFFSKRNAYIKVDDKLQLESINDDLKNSLWSVIYANILKDIETGKGHTYFNNLLYGLLLKKPVDSIPYSPYDKYKECRDLFFNSQWFFIYDFIELIILYFKNKYINKSIIFIDTINLILERENSGYRIIDEKIVAVTDTTEKQTIEEAINDNSFDTAKLHLKDALDKLSDRENPDYRNSIKESISAVEVVVRSITKASTLGDALPKLKDNGIEIPKILNSAMDKLYGYTNGTAGLRHGMMDIPNVNFEEAKYMLVVCSAFINYINCKLSKTK